jgi:Luciferase-like monooxygenase
MEFGLFHEFQDTSEAEAFSQSFALVNAAEQWGLDANFAPDRWVLASPLILAAAIAQRTRRMKTLRLSNGPGPRSASRTAENILRTTKWHWCRSHARSHPYPPIRIAATSIDTYAAIGKLGHAIFDASIAPRGGQLTLCAIRRHRRPFTPLHRPRQRRALGRISSATGRLLSRPPR